jgi:hypothetical protein
MPLASSGSTHDHIALREGRLYGLLDAVGGRVALAHRCPRGNADHDIGELAPARLAHAQSFQVDDGTDVRDRRARRCFGFRRHTIHQHVDVRAHQARGGYEHERGN